VPVTLQIGKLSPRECKIILVGNNLFLVGFYGMESGDMNEGGFVARYSKNLQIQKLYPSQAVGKKSWMMYAGLKIVGVDILPDASVMLVAVQSGKDGHGDTDFSFAYFLRMSEDGTGNYSHLFYIMQHYNKKDSFKTSGIQYQMVGNEVVVYFNRAYKFSKRMEDPNGQRMTIVQMSEYVMDKSITWVYKIDGQGNKISDERLFKSDDSSRLMIEAAFKINNDLYFLGENEKGAFVARSKVK
jgi:hypothetical protein